MSYNSNIGRIEYVVSDPTALDYSYPFQIFYADDIVVYQVPKDTLADDTIHKIELNTHYTVIINGELGGFIRLINNPNLDDQLIIQRALPIDRDIAYNPHSVIYADTLNDDQNLQTYMIADEVLQGNRSLQLPNSLTGVDPVLTSPEPKAVIRWDETGTKLINDAELGEELDKTREYKEFSRQWAINPVGQLVDDTENPPDYSAYHYAQETKQTVDDAQSEVWNAEAEKLTASSYADEAEDVFVKKYTSNNDGTFTPTDTTDYSSFHYSKKAEVTSTGFIYQGVWDASLGVYPTTRVPEGSGDPLQPGDFFATQIPGTISGTPYRSGDWMVFNSLGGWDKVENEQVQFAEYEGGDASTVYSSADIDIESGGAI